MFHFIRTQLRFKDSYTKVTIYFQVRYTNVFSMMDQILNTWSIPGENLFGVGIDYVG